MMTLFQMAERFEKLLDRLPGPIRTPVEREWQPLKELFLSRRAPRLVLLGEGAEAFAAQLLPQHAPDAPDAEWAVDARTAWCLARRRGAVHFVAVTREDQTFRAARAAIANARPDAYVLVPGEEGLDFSRLRELRQFDRERYKDPGPIVAVAAGPGPEALASALFEDASLSGAVAAVLPADDREAVLAAVARALPAEARLEFARTTGEKGVQREIARTVTRSAAAVCTAIGAQPIPLADLPVLTSVQALMVAGIIYASGREWSLATGRDFLAAVGVNVGAAFLFREGARAAVKFFPGWGNAVSGAVAGAGTYAVGLAATGYFVDGLPVAEVRKRFRLSRRRLKSLPDKEGERGV